MVRNLIIGLGLTCSLALAAPAAAGPDGLKSARISGAQACKTDRNGGAQLHITRCFGTPQTGAPNQALARIGIEPARGFGPGKSARGIARSGRTGPVALNVSQRNRALRLELTPRSAALKLSW